MNFTYHHQLFSVFDPVPGLSFLGGASPAVNRVAAVRFSFKKVQNGCREGFGPAESGIMNVSLKFIR